MRRRGARVAAALAIAGASLGFGPGCGGDEASGGAGPGAGGSGGDGGSGGGAAEGGAGGSVVSVGPRPLPDTTATTAALLVGPLPATMTTAQRAFAAGRYVGTRGISRSLATLLRDERPEFVVLHAHPAMWQAPPGPAFFLDGDELGSDFEFVDTRESWFWHEPEGARVASALDGKFLMNVGSTDFLGYWALSVKKQVAAGDFDGVFATSGSPTSVVVEGLVPPDPRLEGTGVATTKLEELGGATYAERWGKWAAGIDAELADAKLPLVLDVGTLEHPWDTTNYRAASGVRIDVSRSRSMSANAWLVWVNRVLSLTADRTVIVAARYEGASDLAMRRYAFGVYLLTKGARSYYDGAAATALEWYPEWGIELGPPEETGATIQDLLAPAGLFRRRFAKGWVYVNPTDGPIPANFEVPVRRIVPSGGGAVPASGAPQGKLSYDVKDGFSIAGHSAEIFLDGP